MVNQTQVSIRKTALLLACTIVIVGAYRHDANARSGKCQRRTAAENSAVDADPRVKEIVRLMNDRTLQAEVANLKSLDLRLDKNGARTMLAVASKDPKISLSPLEKRLRSLAFIGKSKDHREQRMHVTMLEPDLKNTKTGLALK